jgi:cardiolipin synthase
MHVWTDFTLLAVLHAVIIAIVVPAVLLTKKEPTSALAWCLAVIMMPFVGALLFWEFGYNYLHRMAKRKQRRASNFLAQHPPRSGWARRGAIEETADSPELAKLAVRANAFPLTHGNQVALYHDTRHAFDALLAEIEGAQQHIHTQFFILRNDEVTRKFIDALAQKARAGVQVRLLHDAWGSVWLRKRTLQPLIAAGGQVRPCLPLSPPRSMLHFNLRNHRKIVTIDGRIGFTGGMNIGREYLGEDPYFGYWRDSFARLEGPAVAGLQRVFVEDWDFAGGESLNSEQYFPAIECRGADPVQIVESGPDQEVNSIREIYLMAILAARQRLWLASPYFIPDEGLTDALRMARYRGVDVRLLTIMRPDHYLSYYAGRYYWTELLQLGVRVHLYRKGMMHSKLMLVDREWAMIGSANLDRRSLHLNFEIGCMLYSPERIDELAQAYCADLEHSVELDTAQFMARSLLTRVFENGCRLLAPSL